jgi:hypothetical protein
LLKLMRRRAKPVVEGPVVVRVKCRSWDAEPALWMPGEAWAFTGGSVKRVGEDVWTVPRRRRGAVLNEIQRPRAVSPIEKTGKYS